MATTLQKPSTNQVSGSDILNTPSVADALAGVLTHTYRLALKSQSTHWNVTGPLFFSIHEMTEAQYTNMFAAADVLAERIRALGKPAVVNFTALAAWTDGQDPNINMSAEEMVRNLLADHESLAGRMRALVKRAEDADDLVTANLATERAAFHENTAWMLRATVS